MSQGSHFDNLCFCIAGRNFRGRRRPQPQIPQFRRFPKQQRPLRFQRPNAGHFRPNQEPQRPQQQLTLRDTFENYENPDAIQNIDGDYYDDELTYPGLEESDL